MHWTIYKDNQPSNNLECVVGRKINGKSSFGIYTYYSGSIPYWLGKSGVRLDVLSYDHWCAVEDIISYVECMVEDELRSALDDMKNGREILY